MNPSNYCTLPIAKKLHEAGILKRAPEIGDRVSVDCEGDIHEGFIINKSFGWVEVRFDNCDEPSTMESYVPVILYSLAEVWRELPETIHTGNHECTLELLKIKRKDGVMMSCAQYSYEMDDDCSSGRMTRLQILQKSRPRAKAINNGRVAEEYRRDVAVR